MQHSDDRFFKKPQMRSGGRPQLRKIPPSPPRTPSPVPETSDTNSSTVFKVPSPLPKVARHDEPKQTSPPSKHKFLVPPPISIPPNNTMIAGTTFRERATSGGSGTDTTVAKYVNVIR
jgi:hypothetical protein